ncbi:semaphorin-1A-like isoform X1 [Acanthaster planci]|uniref:Semaphorin-1A-like isoform X1 n=1 Tax=Acanthaster planci TaxID=133434 RepID=A0A8B7ZPL1_ACAPL|nr:semaphorin-1A-like isoform X1 [Acanthaster planci]XP_022107354.1 semaphorin-1A-like isoform X2 [Acanthaster planci]XP_022107358.1 semaphorin-1A-like isoform X1 [Acanthaster planci]
MLSVGIQIIGWFLLATLFACAAQNRLPRYPSVEYSARVTFKGLSDAQMLEGSQNKPGNYRTLVFNKDLSQLYIGGRDALHVVQASNLNNIGIFNFTTSTICSSGDPNKCYNYVSIIQPLTDTCLFVCGTDSQYPKCVFAETTDFDTKPTDADPDFSARQGAPSEPNQNFSWIYVSEEKKLFTAVGLRDPFGGGDSSTFRLADLTGCNGAYGSDITADTTTPNWLNWAEFVGEPFLYNGFIYFFYREYASEAINGAGRIVYSRIARVCQNDTGGAEFTTLDGDFVTFKKARLDCSLKTDNSEFYYNEIQGMYKLDTTIFAVFTTPRVGVASSAVCAYDVNEIEQLFDQGEQRGQPQDGFLWTALDDADKPANFSKLFKCSELPQFSPDDEQQKILLNYPLMNLPVPNKLNYKDGSSNYLRPSDAPLFVVDELRLSQIVVDTVANSFDVMFLGTERGTVIKAYLNNSNAFFVEEIDLNVKGLPEAPILSLVKKPTQTAIYVGTDYSVYRLPVDAACSNRTTCGCEKDPHCVCDGSSCVPRTGATSPKKCISDCEPPPDTFNISVVRHLPCSNCLSDQCPGERCVEKIPRNNSTNLYFVARAPEGGNLTASVNCSCKVEDTTIRRSICGRTEHVMVTVVVNVTSSCRCIVDFNTITAKETLMTQILPDESPPASDVCMEEVQDFDNRVSLYRFQLEQWKNRMIEQSNCLAETNSLGYCQDGCQ